jgi:hypothetical protein
MNNNFNFDLMNPYGDLENYFTPVGSERSSESIFFTESQPLSASIGEDEMIPELNLGNIF